jgi:hypothetical protein
LPTIGLPLEVHSELNSNHDALIGGCVYRNAMVSTLQNRYVYATSQFVGLYYLDPPIPSGGVLTRLPFATTWTGTWMAAGQTIHSIGQDEAGEILVVRVATSGPVTAQNGDVFRIAP